MFHRISGDKTWAKPPVRSRVLLFGELPLVVFRRSETNYDTSEAHLGQTVASSRDSIRDTLFRSTRDTAAVIAVQQDSRAARGSMASSGRNGCNSNIAAMRKKRRTIGGFRAHAMGESFDNTNTMDASANFSLSMVPEDQLSCSGGAGSEHIVVAVRVRPLSSAEVAEGKRSCCDVLSSNTLVIRKGADPGAYLRSQKVRQVPCTWEHLYAGLKFEALRYER